MDGQNGTFKVVFHKINYTSAKIIHFHHTMTKIFGTYEYVKELQ